MRRSILSILLVLFVFSANAAYKIYPKPQKITETSTEITYGTRINVVLEEGVSDNVKTFISEILKEKGINPLFSRYSSSLPYIYLGINGSSGEADDFATSKGLSRSVFTSASNKFDPYLLNVDSEGNIVILGNSNNSVFYGVATLRQMIGGDKKIKAATIEDYSYTQYRGLVEGFYGKPYSVEQILSLLDFFKLYKMNTFIYGPKADPYHAGSWDEDYPVSLSETERKNGLLSQSDIQLITAKAKECNVNFVWAIHPGLHGGMSFDSKNAMNPGIEKIMAKFDKMYNLGVRGFGVFIDDMSFVPSAEMTAYLPAQVQAKLKAKYNTLSASADDRVSPLFFVPTAYSIAHTTSSLTQLRNIDSDVVIAFTGNDVWSNIASSSCQTMQSVLGRNPLFWWNNNCNDNYDDRLYMLHMNYRFTAQNAPITALGGVVANPMQEGEASKVFLFGCADYCWNTASFNSTQNWEDCFAYLFPDNQQLSDAFKLFCINSDATNEPADMQNLYSSFRSGYRYGNLPLATTNSLIEKCNNIYNACVMLRSLKYEGEIEDELMYEDIKPWSEKLASMTNIIKKALTWMKSPGDMQNWTEYTNVSKEYAKLHRDSAFIAYTLEGTGGSASSRYFEVHPSQQYMEPFVNYVMEQYPLYAPTLPERNRNPEIIHNLAQLPYSVSMSNSTNGVVLSGLANVSLSTGDYIGINLNNIKVVTVSPSSALSNNLFFEYSINGKEWEQFNPSASSNFDAAYIRIRNVSHNVTENIGIQQFSITSIPSGVITPIEVSTNIPQYQDNAASNLINYSNDSYFWSSRQQQSGDYIRVDLGATKSIHKVEIKFDSNDQPTGEFVVEVSGNGSSWSNIGSFTAADLLENNLSLSVENVIGRYVRMKLNTVSGDKWLKVLKFKVYEGRDVAAAKDDKNAYTTALDDRSLATSYCAVKEGWITYSFTENLNIETIKIYHNSEFDSSYELPSISIKADGEWIDMGYLNSSLTELEVSMYKNLSEIKFEWNSQNLPDIYDIVVSGTPYVGNHDITSVNETGITEPQIYFEDDCLHISGLQGEISIYNTSGMLIAKDYADGLYSLQIQNPQGTYIIATESGKAYKVIK